MTSLRRRRPHFPLLLAAIWACSAAAGHAEETFGPLYEVNDVPAAADDQMTAIVGATLIDGLGNPPIDDAVVIVEGNRIAKVGTRDAVEAPNGSDVVDASGLSLLPGLLDSHFHMSRGERMKEVPGIFLRRGVTTFRDPGRGIEDFDAIRASGKPIPRLMLTGKHFDQAPPAYPHNAVIIANAQQARETVNRYVDDGASAIKVYFRLPLDLIRVVCETAHERGVPVTAHLELVPARDAIEAGLNGIEHITSFGTSLASPAHAERFIASVNSNNAFRDEGRFELWDTLDLEGSETAKELVDLIVKENVYVSPTLGIFEKRPGEKGATPMHVHAFENMLTFTGMCHRAGAPVVVGSHMQLNTHPDGTAYAHEMKLLVECGLTPMEAIEAATMNNAKFFGVSDRLGSIEEGKLADLILVEGNPLEEIGAMKDVQRVMLNGRWVVDRRE